MRGFCINVVQFLFLNWRAPQQTLRTHCCLKAYCATLWVFFSPFLRLMGRQWNETDRGKPNFLFAVLPSSTHLFTVGVEGFLLSLDHTQTHTPQSVGLLWTRDRPVAETCTWQHKHSQETNIHAPGGVGTHDPSKRSAADRRLYIARPLGSSENRNNRRKTCLSAILSTINPTWADRGSNPGLRGERPATNRLSHGTA
jgi:hypothetical protein